MGYIPTSKYEHFGDAEKSFRLQTIEWTLKVADSLEIKKSPREWFEFFMERPGKLRQISYWLQMGKYENIFPVVK